MKLLPSMLIIFISIGLIEMVNASEVANASPLPVMKSEITPQNGPYSIDAVLTTQQMAKLSSRMDGTIASIPVREGDEFKKNQLLLQFDCTQQSAEKQKALAELRSSKQAYYSNVKLNKYKGVSKTELVGSESKYLQSKAVLAQQRHLVDLCSIKAPFNGVITKMSVKAHESIRQGEPLMDISDNQNLSVEFIVPSQWLKWLKLDTSFRLYLSETGRSYQGKVTKIVSHIDAVSRTVKVFGMLNDTSTGLIAGMSGKATFLDKP